MPATNIKAAILGLCLSLSGLQCLMAESWELRPMQGDAIGSRLVREGKIDEAIDLLTSARQGSPEQISAIEGNLCVAHALKREYTTALRYCSQAIKREDADPMVYNNRGAVRAATGDERGAMRDFRQAGCSAKCPSPCLEGENSARAVAQRNLYRLKLAHPELDQRELRFQTRL